MAGQAKFVLQRLDMVVAGLQIGQVARLDRAERCRVAEQEQQRTVGHRIADDLDLLDAELGRDRDVARRNPLARVAGLAEHRADHLAQARARQRHRARSARTSHGKLK